ncbi:hypothetical protein [Cylindrospermopsis raciborskii]|nr:hypothetical protein [Cylindrospermopsis raciborskii]
MHSLRAIALRNLHPLLSPIFSRESPESSCKNVRKFFQPVKFCVFFY